MTHNRFYNHCLISTLILIVGFGFALALTLFASSQGLASQREIVEKDNTPEATR